MRNEADAADRMILRGAMSTAAGLAVRVGARLLFLLVAGRLFGAVLFGAYSIAVAVIEAGLGLAGLSLKKILFQMLDRNEEGGGRPAFHVVLDAAVLTLGASAALAALIMAAAAGLPRTVLGEATATALFWIAPMMAGQALADILLAGTRWKNAVRHEVIGRSLVEPWALTLGAAAAWLAGFRETGLIVGYWAGNLALNFYALAGARSSFGRLHLRSYRAEPRLLWASFRRLVPNTGTDLLSGIYVRMDLYLVAIFLGERWSGIYGMALQIRTPIRQVRQSFDSLLVPLAARTLALRGAAATGEALASAARFILAIQMPFLIAIAAIGVELLDLFGPGFSAAYAALIFLLVAEAIQGAFGVGDLLFVYQRPGVGLRITLAGFLAGLAAALLLIPRFGIGGAGAAMLVGFALQALLRRRALAACFAVRAPLFHSAPPLAAAAAAAAAALALRPFSPVAALVAATCLYALLLWAWMRFTGEQLAIQGFSAATARRKVD